MILLVLERRKLFSLTTKLRVPSFICIKFICTAFSGGQKTKLAKKCRQKKGIEK